MATLAQRLARLENRMGISGAIPRVIFVTGGEATDAEVSAFLASNGIHTTPRDLVFHTTYEAHPDGNEPPIPLRITSITTLDGRPLAV